MRIREVMDILKTIIDNDADVKDNFPTLTVTHRFLDTPIDEVLGDYPWVSLRYVRETPEEVIGTIIEIDVENNEVEGQFRDGLVTAFCWDDTMDKADDLADYVKKALFKKRSYYEDEGLLDISDLEIAEATEARAPFDGFRCVLRFRVWLKEIIDIIAS